MTGTIFDIQRFSIYDGPGIRTNVFFKGCNLRCRWCHNPESQKAVNELMFFPSLCIGCGECAKFCPKAFTDDCTHCGKCASVCRHGAKRAAGRNVDSDEVIALVERDMPFYKTSGGGVTLSGGEPLLQADFAAEILAGCKARGINTALETAANVPWESFGKVLPYLDYVLCDIKCMDSELHRQLTGVPNGQILENAERLKRTGVSLLFRLPVIPTLNDGEVAAVREFAGDTALELLAYHNTAHEKYRAVSLPFRTDGIEPPTEEYMRSLADRYGCIYSPTGL